MPNLFKYFANSLSKQQKSHSSQISTRVRALIICERLSKKAHAFPFQRRRTFMHNIYALLKIAWCKVKPSCIIEVLAGIVSEPSERASSAGRPRSTFLKEDKSVRQRCATENRFTAPAEWSIESSAPPQRRSLLAWLVCTRFLFGRSRELFATKKVSAHGEHLALTHDRKSCLLVQVDGCVRVCRSLKSTVGRIWEAFVIFLSLPRGKTSDKELWSDDLF